METVLASCGHRARPADIRRGMCLCCYRKLREAGCPLPPRASRWDDYDPLAAWVLTLDNATRARLLAALSRPESPAAPLRTDHCASEG
jgi:hypothetical protein